jgi:hypothetical protein
VDSKKKSDIEGTGFSLTIAHCSTRFTGTTYDGKNLAYEQDGITLVNSTLDKDPIITNNFTSRSLSTVAQGGNTQSNFNDLTTDSIPDELQFHFRMVDPSNSFAAVQDIVITELATIEGKTTGDASIIIQFASIHENDIGEPGILMGGPIITGIHLLHDGWNDQPTGSTEPKIGSFLAFKEDFENNYTYTNEHDSTVNMFSQQDPDGKAISHSFGGSFPQRYEINYMPGAHALTSTIDPEFGVNESGIVQVPTTYAGMSDPHITYVRIKLTNLESLNGKTLFIPQYQSINTFLV